MNVLICPNTPKMPYEATKYEDVNDLNEKLKRMLDKITKKRRKKVHHSKKRKKSRRFKVSTWRKNRQRKHKKKSKRRIALSKITLK